MWCPLDDMSIGRRLPEQPYSCWLSLSATRQRRHRHDFAPFILASPTELHPDQLSKLAGDVSVQFLGMGGSKEPTIWADSRVQVLPILLEMSGAKVKAPISQCVEPTPLGHSLVPPPTLRGAGFAVSLRLSLLRLVISN
jgi:hypothetical protein